MELYTFQKIEQTKALYRQMPTLLMGTAAVILLTLSILWNEFSHKALLWWTAVALLNTFLRAVCFAKFHPQDVTADNYRKWLNQIVLGSIASGTLWGLVTVLFVDPNKLNYTLFLTCVYVGYVSAAASSTALYLPAFFAFSIPSSVLFLGNSILIGGQPYTGIALMIVLYSIVMVSFSRNTQTLFLQTARLNFEKNALLDELREQKETAENAVHAKNQFFAAASHDMRQPLHALNLFVEALRPLQKEPQGQTIVEKIDQSTTALSGLMHGMLDISRLDASAVNNEPIDIPLTKITELLFDEYATQISDPQLKMSFNIDKHLAVFIDPILLERVLRNLLDNAVKYTKRGKITIAAETRQENIKICVSDTGKGIPSAELNNVFSEFHQLNNPERDRNKGLGLGLAIVKRLTQLMDVELELNSTLGKGTEVTLLIPKGKASKIPIDNGLQDITIAGLNVLVIEDEQDILDGMQHLLLSWNCKPLLALDEKQAQSILIKADIQPDVIISDFRLRDNQNGIAVIERLRDEFNTSIPAILVTGDTAPDRVIEAQKADITVLYKPIKPHELLDSVRQTYAKAE